MPSTATLPELLWTAIALFGFFGAFGVVWEAYSDWRYIHDDPPPDPIERLRLQLISSTVLTNRCISVFVQAVFVAVGLRALSLPQATGVTAANAALVAVLFILASTAMSIGSVLDYSRRLRYKRIGFTAPPAPGPLARFRAWLAARTKRQKRERRAATKAEAAAHPPTKETP
jgi:hypothetical protein